MARYIDIEAVGIGKAKREQFLVPEYADGWNNAIEIFENEPTADVVEVKHGEWVYNVKYYSCSICAGKRFNLLLGTDAEFCPYCGAKMDKENAQ